MTSKEKRPDHVEDIYILCPRGGTYVVDADRGDHDCGKRVATAEDRKKAPSVDLIRTQ
jgi:hypothetical protein